MRLPLPFPLLSLLPCDASPQNSGGGGCDPCNAGQVYCDFFGIEVGGRISGLTREEYDRRTAEELAQQQSRRPRPLSLLLSFLLALLDVLLPDFPANP